MIKLIAFDLDNTALDDNKVLDSNLKDVLLRLKEEHGIVYTISTGRNEEVLGNYVDELQVDIPYISSNGGIIYQNHKVLSYDYFDQSLNNKLLKLFSENNYVFRAFYADGIISYGRSEFFNRRTKVFDDILVDYIPDKDYSDIKFYKITCDISNNIKSIDKVLKEVNSNSDLLMLKSDENIYCINHYSANKGDALKKICDLQNIDMKDTIAFGDNYSDLSMLKMAGVGVAPSNASEEIKKQVDYVSEYDCNHNAVSNFLKEYFNLK